MKEIWRDIPEYTDRYQVSNKGRVRSKDILIPNNKEGSYSRSRFFAGRLRKNRIDKDGYMTITLTKSKAARTYKIHRLMLLAFRGPSGLCVNHIDGVKTNNVLKNLEYATIKRNNQHAYDIGIKVGKRKFCKETRSYIKSLKGLETQTSLARRLNIPQTTISRIMRASD